MSSLDFEAAVGVQLDLVECAATFRTVGHDRIRLVVAPDGATATALYRKMNDSGHDRYWMLIMPIFFGTFTGEGGGVTVALQVDTSEGLSMPFYRTYWPMFRFTRKDVLDWYGAGVYQNKKVPYPTPHKFTHPELDGTYYLSFKPVIKAVTAEDQLQALLPKAGSFLAGLSQDQARNALTHHGMTFNRDSSVKKAKDFVWNWRVGWKTGRFEFLNVYAQDPLWPNLDRGALADDLNARLDNPFLIQQSFMNWCGPAAVMFEWCRRDPMAFTEFCTRLFDDGQAPAPYLDAVYKPSESFRFAPLAKVGMFSTETNVEIAQLDWMVLGSLESTTAIFLAAEKHYTPLNGTTFVGVEDKYIRDFLGDVPVWHSCWASGEDEVYVQAFQAANEGRFVFLCVSTLLVKSQSSVNWVDQAEFMFGIPAHWILLLPGSFAELDADGVLRIRFSVFSWGTDEAGTPGYQMTLTASPGWIQKCLYGAIIAEQGSDAELLASQLLGSIGW